MHLTRVGVTPHDVYYVPGLFSDFTILHEAFHTFVGLPDEQLPLGADGASLSTNGFPDVVQPTSTSLKSQ